MADIKIYGTLENVTASNVIVNSQQVHYRTDSKNVPMDVRTALDELFKRVPEVSDQNFKGNITIGNLLNLPESEKNNKDIYLVYSSGDNDRGCRGN